MVVLALASGTQPPNDCNTNSIRATNRVLLQRVTYGFSLGPLDYRLAAWSRPASSTPLPVHLHLHELGGLLLANTKKLRNARGIACHQLAVGSPSYRRNHVLNTQFTAGMATQRHSKA